MHLSLPHASTRPLTTQQRLSLLMGVSLLAHAALLSPWSTGAVQPQLLGADEVGDLRVALAPRASQASALHRQVPSAPASAAATPQSPAPVGANEDSNSTDTTENAGLDNQSQRAQAQLHLALARYFTYPPLARRQGWQGEVVLELTLEADGRMRNLQVARSSGYAVLDDAALSSLRRVERLPDARIWMAGASLDVRLPIVYQLQDH